MAQSAIPPQGEPVDLDELHRILTTECELVFSPLEKGNARSYFWKEVVWQPAATTRIVHVHYDAAQTVTRLRLCVSSDNNNSVFMRAPFDRDNVRVTIADEIMRLQARRAGSERQ